MTADAYMAGAKRIASRLLVAQLRDGDVLAEDAVEIVRAEIGADSETAWRIVRSFGCPWIIFTNPQPPIS